MLWATVMVVLRKVAWSASVFAEAYCGLYSMDRNVFIEVLEKYYNEYLKFFFY